MKFVDAAAQVTAPALPALMADTLSELIDGISALARMEASLTAMRAELIDQARQWSEVVESFGAATCRSEDSGWNARVVAHRVLVSELACALRMPERTAETLIADSQSLLHELPQTFAALSVGAISWRHAHTMVDHANSLPTESRAEFEAAVIPAATTLTVAKFDRRARALRERLRPESIDQRHVAAVEDRIVELRPDRDGMAWLHAFLPAVEAQGIYNRITDLARREQGIHETRTLTQLRADMFGDLLLNATLPSGTTDGIRPTVFVTVPVLTLLNLPSADGTLEPATLEGYGPIDRDTALELAAAAPSFVRLLTHPETGAILSLGRNRYAVPADLRSWLRIRDVTCRFPGCNRAARNSELDHTLDWASDGETRHDNLAHLCPGHHRLKHQTGWTVTQLPGAVLQWTSPNGKIYTTEPETRMDGVVPAGAATEPGSIDNSP